MNYIMIRNHLINKLDVMDIEVDFSEQEIRFYLKCNSILKTVRIDYSDEKINVNDKQEIEKDFEIIQIEFNENEYMKRLNEAYINYDNEITLRIATENEKIKYREECEILKKEIEKLKKEVNSNDNSGIFKRKRETKKKNIFRK